MIIPNTITLEPNANLVMACLISGVYDVNRNEVLANNNYELVKDWAESLANAAVKGVVFHNNLNEETCRHYQNQFISFVKVAYNPQFNPNVYRYFVYKDFMLNQGANLKHVFMTDISDVVLLKNPFIDPFFIAQSNTIFCGDEPKKLHNEWMLAHSEVLRNNIADYAHYESKFADNTLLNCGIMGGNATLMLQFITKLCAIHTQANSHNNSAFTGDMGAFNYLARTQFNKQLQHGAPVNTIFKLYEQQRTDCWFKHK